MVVEPNLFFLLSNRVLKWEKIFFLWAYSENVQHIHKEAEKQDWKGNIIDGSWDTLHERLVEHQAGWTVFSCKLSGMVMPVSTRAVAPWSHGCHSGSIIKTQVKTAVLSQRARDVSSCPQTLPRGRKTDLTQPLDPHGSRGKTTLRTICRANYCLRLNILIRSEMA